MINAVMTASPSSQAASVARAWIMQQHLETPWIARQGVFEGAPVAMGFQPA